MNSRLVARSMGVVYVANLLKIWPFLLIGIDHQVFTLLTFLYLFALLFTRYGFGLFDVPTRLFFLLTGVQLFGQILVAFVLSDLGPMVTAVYYFIRFYVFFAILRLASNPDIRRLYGPLLVAALVVTSFHNVLIHPMLLGISSLEIGGNVWSGNSFDIARVNGLIGGTVVDYANVLNAIVIYLYTANLPRHGWLLAGLYTASVLMNFSRSIIAVTFGVGAATILKHRRRAFLAAACALPFVFAYVDREVILNALEAYDQLSGRSDEDRVTMWQELFQEPTFLLFGAGIGSTTGFLLEGAKLSTDSFVLGLVYDAGVIMAAMFAWLVCRFLHRSPSSAGVKLTVGLAFFFMLVVNSGFEKLIVTMSYALALGSMVPLTSSGRREPLGAEAPQALAGRP